MAEFLVSLLSGFYGHPRPIFPLLPQWATFCRPSGTPSNTELVDCSAGLGVYLKSAGIKGNWRLTHGFFLWNSSEADEHVLRRRGVNREVTLYTGIFAAAPWTSGVRNQS